MGSFAVFSEASRLISLNSTLGVKVRFRAAVFYGFPYKPRPKPKIALCRCQKGGFGTAMGIGDM